ncbi:hypothetical protein DFH09DRAFT_1450653 [Mycena vulgaris]|nr:hypothetical protein DFH09DRAFT_1450653 [Mycena vulgaris]
MDHPLSTSTQNHSIFPSPGLQFLSAWIHFLGVTILTYFISCRVYPENLTTRRGWDRLTWPRLSIILIMIDSYLFILSTGLLIFGVGLQTNHHACSAAIFLCVAFYTTSKILIYAFLTEKVYIVWGSGAKRLRCPVYLTCVGTIVLYFGVMLAMYFARIAHFRDGDGVCIIGLKPAASLPLIIFDLYINVLLTSLFLWPIFRFSNVNPKLKRVATRTLIASVAALSTSTVNIGLLTIFHGRQLGWLCLGSCGIDVVFNAAALFWVTSGQAQQTGIQTGTGPARQTDSAPSVSQASMAQRPEFKPFKLLRPKSSPRPPTEFQIHVTTTSDVETSPPSRHVELESANGDLDLDSAHDDLPYKEKRISEVHSHKSADV